MNVAQRIVGLLVLLVACDGAAEPTDVVAPPPGGEDGKADRASATPTYHMIDGGPRLSTSAKKTLVAALRVLEGVAVTGSAGRQRRLAQATLARIASGQVLIGSLAGARGRDLWHMCKDLVGQPACAGAPPDDPAWAGDDALRAALVDELDGYMWGDRLYFRFDADLDPKALAATLVHETNHVLNRSECSYYEDYYTHTVEPTLAWLEEYRAFVAECVLARGSGATAQRCDGWARAQLDERGYGFDPELERLIGRDPRGTRVIAAALFADDGTFGALVPDAAVWPDDFGECEAWAP